MWTKVKWAVIGAVIAVTAVFVAWLTRRPAKAAIAEAQEKQFSAGLRDARQQLADLKTSGLDAIAEADRLRDEVVLLQAKLATNWQGQGLTAGEVAERLSKLALVFLVSISLTLCVSMRASAASLTPRVVTVDGQQWVALPPDQMAKLGAAAEQTHTATLALALKSREALALRDAVKSATTAVVVAQRATADAVTRGDLWRTDAQQCLDSSASAGSFFSGGPFNFVLGVLAGGAAGVLTCKANAP